MESPKITLTNNQGISLELWIAGYQFPEITDDWDANWLMVAGEVRHPRGAWSFIDPCLTTTELGSLVAWLELVVRGESAQSPLHPMEQCLQFHHVLGPDPDIEVRLAHGCAPPWSKTEGSDEDVALRFPLTASNAEEWIQAGRELQRQFPERESAE